MRRFQVGAVWLAALFPVLSLWRRNVDEVSRGDALEALLAAALLGTLVWGVGRLTLQRSARVVVAGVGFLLAFFGWAPLRNLLAGHLPDVVAAGLAAAVALAVLVVGLRLARRAAAPERLATFLALAALLLVAWEVTGLTVAAWQGRSAPVAVTGTPERGVAPDPLPPDIYTILLDGYARADVLHDLYGVDNSDFLEELRRLGFQVCPDSRANYVKTLHALSCLFNMAYVQELVPVPEDWQRSRRLVGTVHSNRVVHLLRQQGYTIHSFDTGYAPAEFSNPDFHHVADHTWSEFHSVLLRTTPLPVLFGGQGDLHERHRRRLRFVLDRLPHIDAGNPPRFVFAHVLAPHPPFVFDRDGEPVDSDRPFGYYDGSDYMKRNGSVEGYRHDYAEQARWVTQQVLAAVRDILEQAGDRPPVILLLSDHGPGSGLDWASLDDTDLRERFGILFALFLPGFESLRIDDDFSPVNAFRLIFDLYFGTDWGPIEARSYYTFQSQPYHYFDVTDPQRPLVHKRAPSSGFGR